MTGKAGKLESLFIRKFRCNNKKSKHITLPGFEKVPLYNVTVIFFRGLWEGAISTRASSIAFNFFIALFPAIIFFFTLIPFISSIDFQFEILALLKSILPVNAYIIIKDTLEDIITNRRGSLLSFGFVAALYFSTSGLSSMIDAFNNSYHIQKTRSWMSQRLLSIVLTIILTILITTAVILMVFSETVINYLVHMHVLEVGRTYYLLIFGKWVIILALLFFAISILYYFAPVKKDKWRFISAGSTLATLLTIATSVGFSYYINNFGNYNKLYGSIGTILVLLVWMYFNSLVLLIGFELNVSIQNAKANENKPTR
ncbi:MAG: YihY/virulence factor BrkB family protein [Bacteroidia bacterium]|nr:YihY/virulence factor BrkB family protein [Bacteroidia bacterium]